MSRRTQKNVGVIGLGIIGERVANSLRRAGFQVFVWNRTPKPFPNFVGSPAEIAQLCDFVQIFVSDDEALLQIAQQLKQSLNVHHVIMAHSTVAPATMRAAAEVVHRRGAQLLDAPFTGSKIAAENGELAYYVAGDDAAFRRARPVLEASSKEIIEIGEIGQATTIKLATNMVTAATVQAAAEALALVHSSGLELEKFVAAMRGNASNSATLSMKLPKMLDADFAPHFSVKHMLKDVQIATRLARSHGLALRATEAARDSLLEEQMAGRGDFDYASIAHVFFPNGRAGSESALAAEEQADFDGLEEREQSEPSSAEAEDAVEEAEGSIERIEAEAEIEPAPEAEPEGHAGMRNGAGETPPEGGEAPGTDASDAAEAEQPEEQTNTTEQLDDTATEENESGTADELLPTEHEPAPPAVAELREQGPRRGLLSRMFGRASDE